MKRYGEYKDSGIEWIDDYPASWKLVNLSSLVDQRKNKNSDLSESNVLSLSYGKIKKRKQDNSGLLPESFDTYNIIEEGDIVLRLTDLQNDVVSLRVGRSGERGIITSAYTTLVPRIESRYLFYQLAAFDFWKGFYGLAGGVRQSLNYDGIKNLRFLLPSLQEQRAIASFLDAKTAEIDSLIEETEKSIELLEEYRKSVISEAVTKGLDPNVPMKDSGIEWIGEIPEHWTIRKITTLADRRSGHTPDKTKAEYWDNGDIVWVSLADSPKLRTQRYIADSTSKTTALGIENSSAELLPKGSVLLSRDATVGLCAIADCDLAVSQHFMAYVCGKDLHNEYLLGTFYAMDQELKKLSMGSTIPTIGLPLIKGLKIPVPPLQEQLDIAAYLARKLKEIDSAVTMSKEEVNKLRDYRKSLISEAVTGKFKVPGVE